MSRAVLVTAFLSCCCVAAAIGHLWSPLRLANGFATVTAPAEKMDVFRLPADVTPVSYELRVDADLQVNFSYAGQVDIVVRAAAPVCRITLNAKDVQVTAADVVDWHTNVPLSVAGRSVSERNEQLTIALNDTARCLIPGRYYVVKLAFTAPLRDDMTGFYKSSYREDGVTKWLAVTKFEPTHARKAFPCFDEPALKAHFKVSVKRRSDQISLSNMPLMNSTKIERTNMFWDHFQETPPMSSYLVAFFVGEFYAIKTRSIGIYTHRSHVSQAEYIANESPKLLKAMEDFTGMEYPLPKLDLLAIPDFAAGAMENWGLNTYRERLLLLTTNSKTKTKELVTTVVQHELSHQWFGDLVTCAWWDYLWLNEGFATFFEYLATKTVEPDWRLEEVFVIEVHQVALEYDQKPTHAISGSVNTPAEIRGMFDDISYSKAGAVLRMLQYTVTGTHFREALQLYLDTNQYEAATPENLWNAFENVLFDADYELGENVNVTHFMKSWTEQMGYPLVTVSKMKNQSLVVTQERFSVVSNETDAAKWVVGLTYTTQNDRDFEDVSVKSWLTDNATVLPNLNETGWYIFNLQSTGFFRVNYDEENWEALTKQLHEDPTAIHVLNRAQLIDDAFNLARVKQQLDYTFVLDLTEYLEKEIDVIPWYSAKNGFSYLIDRMRRCPHGYKDFKTYLSYLVGIIYTKTENLLLNPETAEHSVKTGWNAFSNWACKLDNEKCTKTASRYFEMWRQGITIPADIKDTALCAGVKNGNSEVWNAVLDVYVNSESASDRQSAQNALGCSKDPNQLAKYLDFMFEGHNGPILPQDFRVIYNSLASSVEGIPVLIDFLTNKFERILNEIINGEQVATSIYSLLSSKVALKEEIQKIDVLRTDPSVPVHFQRMFNFSFATAEDNFNWFKLNHHTIGQWSKASVHRLGLDVPVETTVTAENTSTIAPELSSASFSDTSTVMVILPILSSLIFSVFYLL